MRTGTHGCNAILLRSWPLRVCSFDIPFALYTLQLLLPYTNERDKEDREREKDEDRARGPSVSSIPTLRYFLLLVYRLTRKTFFFLRDRRYYLSEHSIFQLEIRL